jgi:succinate-semialdehyde dehydrogenase/glutarate-semialdehyde dehydrogenase
MCTKSGLEKVKEHIEDARKKGAKILCGGKKPEGEKFARGLFFEPTIIADANHDMLVMKEETFGPAVGVMPYDALSDSVRLANDTPYGLAAIIYTKSLLTAEKAARKLQAGNVAINNVDAGVINAPYGGWKASGFGHEHGTEGLFEYLKAKHIRIRVEDTQTVLRKGILWKIYADRPGQSGRRDATPKNSATKVPIRFYRLSTRWGI